MSFFSIKTIAISHQRQVLCKEKIFQNLSKAFNVDKIIYSDALALRCQKCSNKEAFQSYRAKL